MKTIVVKNRGKNYVKFKCVIKIEIKLHQVIKVSLKAQKEH